MSFDFLHRKRTNKKGTNTKLAIKRTFFVLINTFFVPISIFFVPINTFFVQ